MFGLNSLKHVRDIAQRGSSGIFPESFQLWSFEEAFRNRGRRPVGIQREQGRRSNEKRGSPLRSILVLSEEGRGRLQHLLGLFQSLRTFGVTPDLEEHGGLIFCHAGSLEEEFKLNRNSELISLNKIFHPSSFLSGLPTTTEKTDRFPWTECSSFSSIFPSLPACPSPTFSACLHPMALPPVPCSSANQSGHAAQIPPALLF